MRQPEVPRAIVAALAPLHYVVNGDLAGERKVADTAEVTVALAEQRIGHRPIVHDLRATVAAGPLPVGTLIRLDALLVPCVVGRLIGGIHSPIGEATWNA